VTEAGLTVILPTPSRPVTSVMELHRPFKLAFLFFLHLRAPYSQDILRDLAAVGKPGRQELRLGTPLLLSVLPGLS
jgi:hypothetical protein